VVLAAHNHTTPQEIKHFLEWAGQRILALPARNLYPQNFRSFWPDYPDDKHTAYGYSNTKLRPPAPSKDEIPLVDEILQLVLMVPIEKQRRILNARALISPINGRYLFPWSKISVLLRSDPRTIKTLHRKGLEFIAIRVEDERVGRFRAIIGVNQYLPC
jgi:hypothetical protein